ncbi:PDZ domain-containing protein [Brevundimonas lutea]|uniref:PDZ domain-containing protein n=1 Tax=Brevundimonas lutea TaxID=2293980 RepID=UPI000F01566D|nr:PDZ domain-containing protein [Brevundimonas lutea]
MRAPSFSRELIRRAVEWGLGGALTAVGGACLIVATHPPAPLSPAPVVDQDPSVESLAVANTAFAESPDVGVSSAPTQYRLFGVRQAGPASSAILAMEDGRQHAVRIDALLPDGAILSSVASDHVILTLGERRVRVEFTTEPPQTGSPDVSAGDAPSWLTDVGASRSRLDGPRGAGDATSFTSALRPVRRGQERGFVWRPGARVDVLAKAGLRPGDTLVGLNGMEFHDPERLQELADELAMGRAVSLTYVRGGQRHEATVGAR